MVILKDFLYPSLSQPSRHIHLPNKEKIGLGARSSDPDLGIYLFISAESSHKCNLFFSPRRILVFVVLLVLSFCVCYFSEQLGSSDLSSLVCVCYFSEQLGSSDLSSLVLCLLSFSS
ncbi:hypothetical protein SLA2020_299620 [Shorea laevis]